MEKVTFSADEIIILQQLYNEHMNMFDNLFEVIKQKVKSQINMNVFNFINRYKTTFTAAELLILQQLYNDHSNLIDSLVQIIEQKINLQDNTNLFDFINNYATILN